MISLDRMERKIRCFQLCVFVLILCFLFLHFHGVETRPLKMDGRRASMNVAEMKHDGPSPSRENHWLRILMQLNDTGPSPGVGH